MQKLTQIAAALIIGTTLSASVLAAGNTFVTVNGTAVSQNMADVFINEQKAQGAPDSAELKNAVREELVRRELLMQEAKKSGVDKKADVAAQAEAMRQSVIIRAYVQEFTKKNPISDAQLKSQYDAIKAQLGDTEYKSRHILVKEEAEAVAVIENLKKGAKFEELAKQSIDPIAKGAQRHWCGMNTATGNGRACPRAALIATDDRDGLDVPGNDLQCLDDFRFHVRQGDGIPQRSHLAGRARTEGVEIDAG